MVRFYFMLTVYTDQPISSKSPPTRDKLHPEGKAQVRIRNRNRVGQDATDSGKCDWCSLCCSCFIFL